MIDNSEFKYANKHRGEISAVLSGEVRVLCLTLGALAELESAFDVVNLSELAEKFATVQLSSSDLLKIIAAGLRGGGNTFTNFEVGELSIEGGVSAYAALAAQLLKTAFCVDQDAKKEPQPTNPN